MYIHKLYKAADVDVHTTCLWRTDAVGCERKVLRHYGGRELRTSVPVQPAHPFTVMKVLSSICI